MWSEIDCKPLCKRSIGRLDKILKQQQDYFCSICFENTKDKTICQNVTSKDKQKVFHWMSPNISSHGTMSVYMHY